MPQLAGAHRAAKELGEPGTYRRLAEWIWQGRVDRVIDELRVQADRFPATQDAAADPRRHTRQALTYYQNHGHE